MHTFARVCAVKKKNNKKQMITTRFEMSLAYIRITFSRVFLCLSYKFKNVVTKKSAGR